MEKSPEVKLLGNKRNKSEEKQGISNDVKNL
jgi:hypothetical protein